MGDPRKDPATYQCTLCPKRYTRAFALRNHLRTHVDERPFACTVCGKAFTRESDRKSHEKLHSGEKRFACIGDLKRGGQWGCGRTFARRSNLCRHFRSEAAKICIKPLLGEANQDKLDRQAEEERQRTNLRYLISQEAAASKRLPPATIWPIPSMDTPPYVPSRT
ncbi:hypothetical protein LY76DRAFT_585177 [Colletotrichum caudatum]|nr:hypothetical protein LY76DRAFT_585177 [Colletotrichum caudatum]